jgi:biopolymer transport protein ExbD
VKIKTNRELFAVMESVAMTDIVLNMFIFFFISFSLLYTFNPVKQVKIPVNLPKTEAAETQEKEPLQVTVNREGTVYVGPKAVALNQVRAEVEAALRKSPDRIVLLRGDEGANYGRIVKVLEESRRAGAKRLGLAAEVKKQ